MLPMPNRLESQKRLLQETGMLEPIRAFIQGGMSVLGTCAGMILLCDQLALAFHPEVSGDKRLHEYFLRESFVYK